MQNGGLALSGVVRHGRDIATVSMAIHRLGDWRIEPRTRILEINYGLYAVNVKTLCFAWHSEKSLITNEVNT